MKQPFIKTSAHAKCIIAGEHIVLRGMPAIVFPIFNKTISLSYQVNDCFKVKFIPLKDKAFSQCFLKALGSAVNVGNLFKKNKLHGLLTLENNIPMGAGIGFSAALCVVIARWFIQMNWLSQNKLFTFSQYLENIFHGKSSGLDIAGAMNDNAIHYEATGKSQKFIPSWEPLLYLSYSGIPKDTKLAVQHVQAIRNKYPKLAQLIDEEMLQSVHMVERALSINKQKGLQLLAQALEQANFCFQEWNLLSSPLQNHMDKLKALGALATKPTGAGEGGYVLSLWENPPPLTDGVELIPVAMHKEEALNK